MIHIPYTKIFIGALIFFIIAAGFAFYKFFGGSNTVSGNNIAILGQRSGISFRRGGISA